MKQTKNEGEFCATLGNRFPSQSRDAKEEKQREKSNMKQIFIAMRNSKGEQLQEKFRVLPRVHCNISFRSSGSQESNASNGVQFRAKMKKL